MSILTSQESIECEPALTETQGYFQMEVRRLTMIVDFMSESCDGCRPARLVSARTFAFFTGRLSVASAVKLIDERHPCEHSDG